MWNAGTLEVPYRVGQHFVTEATPATAATTRRSCPPRCRPRTTTRTRSTWSASAARWPPTRAPGTTRSPTELEPIRDELTELGGRPAWLTVFRLHFQREGLQAKDELVGIACIDVGKPSAAILYVSIPGTHRQFDWVVDDVLNSVRMI